MEISLAIIFSVVSLVATICSIASFIIARKKDAKAEGRKEIEGDIEIKTTLSSIGADNQYIKRRIDDVLLEQRETNKTLDAHGERLTRVEESTKQAHRRLDELRNHSRINKK